MTSNSKRVLVSGATGFLGRRCCAALSAAGFEVAALVRNPVAANDLGAIAAGGIFRAELPGAVDKSAFQPPARALVHCAYETHSATREQARQTNVSGTEALVRLARQTGVGQLVFVSSLAAHAHTGSYYGRTKHELESLFQEPGDSVVRLATIIGPGGVFERVRDMIRKLPVIPLFYQSHNLQTIWIDDVCNALVGVIENAIGGVTIAAHPEAIPMRDFYGAIAALDRRSVTFCPFPGDLAVIGIRALERLGIRPPISSDNILGVKYLRYCDPGNDLQRLGIQPLGFRESLDKLRLV